MKCSQKNGFIYILFYIILGVEHGNSSVPNLVARMQFPKLTSNILDSFPNPAIKPHKIVKKQMAVSDYSEIKSTTPCPDDLTLGQFYQDQKKSLEALKEAGLFRGRTKRSKNEKPEILAKNQKFLVKRNARNKVFDKSKVQGMQKADSNLLLKTFEVNAALSNPLKKFNKDNEKPTSEKHNLREQIGKPCNRFARFIDRENCHWYYECEPDRYGKMILKHKQCCEGEVFIDKFHECMKKSYLRMIERSKRDVVGSPKKLDMPDPCPDSDTEPSNEWLNVNQGCGQKIPPEFKPKKKLKLKIYHLRCKRKFNGNKRKKKSFKVVRAVEGRIRSTKQRSAKGFEGHFKRQGLYHPPRSFLIRINKKEGKFKPKEIGETPNEDEEDETDDDDDEEIEGEDNEDEESENDDSNDDSKSESQGMKEVFKAPKASGSKEKFRDGSAAMTCDSEFKSVPNKKKEFTNHMNFNVGGKSKTVLIDANIKVDSSLKNILKNILYKGKEDVMNMEDRNLDGIATMTAKGNDSPIKENQRTKKHALSALCT